MLLKGSKYLSLHNQDECLDYLGKNFRIVLNITNSNLLNREVGEIFLKENICVHLKQNMDKINALCLMIKKLYALVNDEILPDNLDAL